MPGCGCCCFLESEPKLCQLLVPCEGGCFVFTPSYSIPSAKNFGEVELELPSLPVQSPVSSINIITAVSLGDISFLKNMHTALPPLPG